MYGSHEEEGQPSQIVSVGGHVGCCLHTVLMEWRAEVRGHLAGLHHSEASYDYTGSNHPRLRLSQPWHPTITWPLSPPKYQSDIFIVHDIMSRGCDITAALTLTVRLQLTLRCVCRFKPTNKTNLNFTPQLNQPLYLLHLELDIINCPSWCRWVQVTSGEQLKFDSNLITWVFVFTWVF